MYFSRALPLLFFSSALAAPTVTTDNEGLAVRDTGALAGSAAHFETRGNAFVSRQLSLDALVALVRSLIPDGTDLTNIPVTLLISILNQLPVGTTIQQLLLAIRIILSNATPKN
jgi:hypothetical protein